MGVATAVGLLCGVLASLTETRGFSHRSSPCLVATIITSRMVLGFTIGISAWRISWWWHGMALGLILDLLLAFAVQSAGNEAFVGALLGGFVFSFLIESVNRVVFKARMACFY